MSGNISNVASNATETHAVDCKGKDSGLDVCWPAWVNIGVPILVSIAFVIVLVVMFIVWPKEPPVNDDDDKCTVGKLSRKSERRKCVPIDATCCGKKENHLTETYAWTPVYYYQTSV